MRRAALAAALAAAIAFAGWGLSAPAGAQGAQYDAEDEWHGLPEDAGREETFYNCVACHSMAIVMQQRLSRRVWNDVIDWMEDEMGLPELAENDRRLIVDYLVKHFGQDAPR